jgi:hypothetical protein
MDPLANDVETTRLTGDVVPSATTIDENLFSIGVGSTRSPIPKGWGRMNVMDNSSYPQLRMQKPNRFTRRGMGITTRNTPDTPVFYRKTNAAHESILVPALDGKDNNPEYGEGNPTISDELYTRGRNPLGINAYGEDIRKYRPANLVTDPDTGITFKSSIYGNPVRSPHDSNKWVAENYHEIVANLPISGSANKENEENESTKANKENEALKNYDNALRYYERSISKRAKPNGGGKKSRKRHKRKTLRKKGKTSKRRRNKSRRRK